MKKQKHTPGPWTAIEGKNFDGEREIAIRGHEQGRIMRIANAWFEANAHLIAAAPELLEVCRKVEAYLQGIRTDNEFQEADLVAMVQTTIAKAEGK